MVHRIDAVGGDVHLEEVSIAGTEVVHALHRNATQRQVFGELMIVDRDIRDIGAEPAGQDIHANCSRKRISPE